MTILKVVEILGLFTNCTYSVVFKPFDLYTLPAMSQFVTLLNYPNVQGLGIATFKYKNTYIHT
jgi:hypothetical protein